MGRIKNMGVVFDILSQSQDNFLVKSQFITAFFSHYIGKIFGLNLNILPKMRIKLQDCIFITRKKTIDFWIFWKNYEKEISTRLDKFKDKGTFIDIGANIGRYSLLMVKKGWKVYSFEPIKNNFIKLQEHIKINNIKKNIKVKKIALGNKKEKRNIYFEPHKHGEGSLVIKKKRSFSERVGVDLLDNLMKDKKYKKPILLKIDVESFEYEVLIGAKKFIQKYHPIIILEMWQKEKDIKFLEDLGYKNRRDFWYYEK
jgi:FkbM family methyltransferase